MPVWKSTAEFGRVELAHGFRMLEKGKLGCMGLGMPGDDNACC